MAKTTVTKQGEPKPRSKTTRGTMTADTIAKQDAEMAARKAEAESEDKGRLESLVAVKNIPPHRNRGVRVWAGASYKTLPSLARQHVSAGIAKKKG